MNFMKSRPIVWVMSVRTELRFLHRSTDPSMLLIAESEPLAGLVRPKYSVRDWLAPYIAACKCARSLADDMGIEAHHQRRQSRV